MKKHTLSSHHFTLKKTILYAFIFLSTSWPVISDHNREPDSPPGKYQFTVHELRETIHRALLKADAEIVQLTASGDLEDIAKLYFKDYLDRIASYNDERPKPLDILESYKTDLTNAFVLKEFKETFPHVIYDESKWMFNSVGGIYAATLVLYVSRQEYLVIWGTTLESHGKFSGYYPFMNEFDILTRGEMHSHDLDATGHASVMYHPYIQDGILGTTVDTSHLLPKNVRSYTMKSHTYMVSYAQGKVVKAFLPGAFAPGIFVNQDWGGLRLHVKESGKSYWLKKRRKLKKLDPHHFRTNPNYRPIYIIDEFRDSEQSQEPIDDCH